MLAHGTLVAMAQVKQAAGSPAYVKALRKRRVWVEPLFAEAKQWHGLQRFRRGDHSLRAWHALPQQLLAAERSVVQYAEGL